MSRDQILKDVKLARETLQKSTGKIPNTAIMGDGVIRALGFDPEDFEEFAPGMRIVRARNE